MMQTKECRHCKQPIHKDARRCQHCQGMQSWISDQKDPRKWVVVFVPLLVILGIALVLTRSITKPLDRNDLVPSSLSVKNVSYRFGAGARGSHIFVYGTVSNQSDRDAGRTCLRVNLTGQQRTLIDSFVQTMDVAVVPAKGKTQFRLVAETPARPDEISKAEVIVESIRARGRWE